MKQIISTVVLLFATITFFAQKTSKADKLFERRAYVEAAQLYENYNLEDAQSIKRIADSYYLNVNMRMASQWYKILVDRFPQEIDNTTMFRYSQSLKGVKNYKEADSWMSKYNNEIGQKYPDNNTLQYITRIDKDNAKSYTLKKASLSSDFSAFGAAFYGDKVVFASSNNTSYSKTFLYNQQPYLDLFIANKDKNGDLSNPVLFSKELTTGTHEASPVFTKDLNTVYFTRTSTKKVVIEDKKYQKLKLFKATKVDGKWSNIEELPFNSDTYSCAHPALSPDESKLYFVSDMPGTIGAMDIFEVEIIGDDEYSTPYNLGPEINTENREMFPFIAQNGTLYFSSDGHLGLGSLDVFSSDTKEGRFQPPKNLGSVINSNLDDFAFVVNDSTNQGFLSSNRGNYSVDNIYYFKESCSQLLKGKVYDKFTKELITEATVEVIDANNSVVNTTKTDNTGAFSIELNCSPQQYKLKSSKFMYDYDEKNIQIKNNLPLQNIDFMISLKTSLVPIPAKAEVGEDLNIVLDLKPILFDYNNSEIKSQAEIELRKVIDYMRKYPNSKIDVRSHTDSRGGDKFNFSLSNRRNEATKQYIITQGNIQSNRISGRGYGETKLLNKCSNGVKCTEEEHQENRRSEFIVIEK